MSVIEWNNSFVLGVPEIDGHHQHLLELFNKTYQVFVAQAGRGALETVLDELVNYATYHFAAEERLMAECGYQSLPQHRREHEGFIERITVQQHDFYAGRTTLTLELIVLLRDWVLDHILRCDKELAAVLPRQPEPELVRHEELPKPGVFLSL